MIKLKYKLFPQSFVNKIVKTIQLSENSEIAKSNLKNKFGLDDLEVKYILGYKLKYLIELINTNNVRGFVRRLETIHSLDGCIGLETITRILKENNISYKEYETTDYEYYNKKGSKITSPTCDLIIIEITNPNHNQHLEIEIDKSLDSVVDLWFGSYWFEYYECRSEQEFIDSYIDTIKDIMKDKMDFVCYHSASNNRWYSNYCYCKDENPEIDNSDELEQHMKLLNKNKIAFGTNVYYYNWSELKIYNKRATYNANRIPNEALVKEHKYCDLQYFYNCVKLYYSKDGYKRLVFCELENGSIITRLQSLDIYTSDIPKNTIYCAEWKTISGKGSFYSNVDCAIKEYKNEIDEFLEVDIAEISKYIWNGYQEYYATIDWVKEEKGGRTFIPYGNRYWPQIIVLGSGDEEPNHSIILRNIEGISKYQTIALIKYALPGATDKLKENIEFYVCEGNRKVAKGIITAIRENADI